MITDLINNFVKNKHDNTIHQIMGVFESDQNIKFLLIDENNEFHVGSCQNFIYLIELPENSKHKEVFSSKQLLVEDKK